MEFTVDRLSEDLVPKIEALIEENHAVSGQFEELDMDWDTYLSLANNIVVIGLKDDGIYVGILIFFIGPYPHNKNQLFADQLTYFIQRGYRDQAKKMLDLSETILASYGCEFVVQSARYGSRFGKSLELEGYEPLDIKYSKRLV